MTLKSHLSPVGESWEITEVEIFREKRHDKNDERRYRIAMMVLGGITSGVVGLGAFGLYTLNFGPISSFWTAGGPIFGTIIGYYFGKTGDTS